MVKVRSVWINLLRNALIGVFVNAFFFCNCLAQSNATIQFAPIGSLSLDSGVTWLQQAFDSSIRNDVQVIGLGEVSHGGWEPMAFKAKMIQYLVKKRGYRNILFEVSDLEYIMPLRQFLLDNKRRDLAMADSLVDKIGAVPVNMAVFRELFRWLKLYNMAHPDDMVQVKGFELPPNTVAFYNYFIYKYLIPFDNVGVQNMIYQWSVPYTTDSLKLQNMFSWFNANKNKLTAGLSKEEFDWLNYNIQSQLYSVQHMSITTKDNQAGLGSIRADWYRDSIMALNVKFLAGQKRSIVWAHNGHIYEGSSFMGSYLGQFYQSKYFALLTDFSIHASVTVYDKNGSNPNGLIYTKQFEPAPITAAYKVLHDYGIATGVFIQKELSAKQIHDRVNAISVEGTHVVIGSSKAFDVLVVFDKITNHVK